MASDSTEHERLLAKLMKRVGEPSWLILSALEPASPIHGAEILHRADAALNAANHPQKHLDPSTMLYALRRMERDGLVRPAGGKPVEVRGPHGSTRTEPRPVYTITGLGAELLERHLLLHRAMTRHRLRELPASLP